MAVIDDVKTAYKAVIRVDLNDVAAQAIADAITSGQTTLDAYIDQLINQAAPSTVPAVAFASFFQGVTPDSARTDALTAFSLAQFASYTKLGVGNPSLGPYEALGLGFAIDPTTSGTFQTKYGALNDAQFVNTAYAEVYGQPPSAGAAANLLSQIAYFTTLYTNAGISPDDAALRARGATLGQIVGYAFTDPTAAAKSVLDNQVDLYLTELAHGATNIYGQPLPPVGGTGNPGVTLTLTPNADFIDPGQTNPAFKSTAGDDIIRALKGGDLTSNDTINAGAGQDTLVANTAALTQALLKPAMNSVEKAFLAGANITFDAGSSTGLQQLWNDGSNVASKLTFQGLGTDVIVGVKGAGASATTVGFTGVGGSNDAANFALDASKLASKLVANGIETANVNVLSSSGITFDDNALKVMTLKSGALASTGDVSLDLTVASIAHLTSIDAGGLKGGLTVTPFNAVNDLSVKGGAGNDSININAAATKVLTIDTGDGSDFIYAGNGADIIKAGAGNDIVDGYFGADTITLGAGNDVARYLFVGESKGSGFDTITDFKVDGADVIDVKALGPTTFFDATAQITTQNAVDALGAGATLTQALTAACGAGRIGLNQTGFFDFGGDTYVVVNKTAAGFNDAQDLVVKLSGIVPLVATDFTLT